MKIVIDGQTADIPGGGSAEEVYSTEETRIGTWIDGKPLYRKVFQAKTGTVITPSESNLIARVDGASIDRIVFMTGMFYPFNAETQMPVPNYQGVASSPHFMISVWANTKNGVLEIRERHLKETASDADIVVRIEYTKTTD